MPEDHQSDTVLYNRRREAHMPSMRSHLLRALGILILSASATALGFRYFGNPDHAQSKGEVRIDPVPLPEASDSLNGDGSALPDLLQGEVAEGINPTERLDALGNPVTTHENGLAGGNQTPQLASNSQAVITTPGPRTILIDGQPVGGAFPSTGLRRAPIADITRKSPYGSIPTISPNGNKAVTSYARPFSPSAGKRQIAIIIGGLGIDRNLTRRIINETPPEVSLSFAAHANGLQTMIHQARDRGHEVLIELPMEGDIFNAAEPGANRTLKADVSAAENIRNLDRLMSRAQGYFAVTNYNGSKLVTRSDAMSPILAHMADTGIGFVYDGAHSAPSLSALSAASGLPYKSAYTIIDNNTDRVLIDAELSRLQDAGSTGQDAIGIGFALPETLAAVKNWAATLPASNVELAPASYVLNK